MDGMGYMNVRNYPDKNNKSETIVEGNFLDFDRVFYQKSDKNNLGSLLLFSEKKQLFHCLELKSGQMSALNINAEKAYQQVEVYDKKIFCINRESLTMDIFFLSKKQNLYHKRTICFSKKELRLKEKFCLTIWKHQEAGVMYRCLLGPLADGRYMNFDLLERYFDYRADTEQIIPRVIFISLTLQDEEENPQDVVCAVDEVRKSIICFGREKQEFFEYNDFSGEDSKSLEVLYLEEITRNKNNLRRMYFYYPYDFFTKREKNQLQAKARNVGEDTDLDTFVRNQYREVLLCMAEGPFLKLSLHEGMPALWQVTRINAEAGWTAVDITMNDHTGEIYCLCGQEIRILKNSGRKPDVLYGNMKRMYFYNTDLFS